MNLNSSSSLVYQNELPFIEQVKIKEFFTACNNYKWNKYKENATPQAHIISHLHDITDTTQSQKKKLRKKQKIFISFDLFP